MAFFYFLLFLRIGSFQWVTAEKNKKIRLPLDLPVRLCANHHALPSLPLMESVSREGVSSAFRVLLLRRQGARQIPVDSLEWSGIALASGFVKKIRYRQEICYRRNCTASRFAIPARTTAASAVSVFSIVGTESGQLDTTLTDIGSYLKAYAQSFRATLPGESNRRNLERGGPTSRNGWRHGRPHLRRPLSRRSPLTPRKISQDCRPVS